VLDALFELYWPSTTLIFPNKATSQQLSPAIHSTKQPVNMAFPLMLIIFFVFIYLFTYFGKRRTAQQQARLHSNIRARFHPVALRSILRSVSHKQAEKHANNRVEFSKQLHTHVFLKEEAAKQRSKTYLVHLCPYAPSRKKPMDNVLERQRIELKSCSLAARFDELQVEKEKHVEDLFLEEVVEFDPQDNAVEEVQFNDVGLQQADPVVLRGRKTPLQRETAALNDNLGAYWSRASPRYLTRSSRARKQPDRFISSF
jgi:hypothetical protein